jgi:hypothetical protein
MSDFGYVINHVRANGTSTEVEEFDTRADANAHLERLAHAYDGLSDWGYQAELTRSGSGFVLRAETQGPSASVPGKLVRLVSRYEVTEKAAARVA